jgi:hypothetical protein
MDRGERELILPRGEFTTTTEQRGDGDGEKWQAAVRSELCRREDPGQEAQVRGGAVLSGERDHAVVNGCPISLGSHSTVQCLTHPPQTTISQPGSALVARCQVGLSGYSGG